MVKDELIGKQLGSYQLIELLGHGAFGSVYLGKHFILSNKPPVAVKVLNATLNAQDEFDRFFQEALMLDALTHPHILPVLDANIHDGYPFFVTEYAAGGSLRDHMDQAPGHPFPLEEILDILNQVGQGLQYAHDHNIVHRDLKPANILFDGDGNALLADFGIAMPMHKTRRADEVGTPAYMAPEQFRGKVSKRSDQYALACIAYELFTGQPVFDSDDPLTIAYQHVHELPIPPGELSVIVTPDIEEVLLKALAKQRNDRFESVVDFIEALYNAANVESQPTDEQESRLYTGELDDSDEYYAEEPETQSEQYEQKSVPEHSAPPPYIEYSRVPPRTTHDRRDTRPPAPQRTTPHAIMTTKHNTAENTAYPLRQDTASRRAIQGTPRQTIHIPELLRIWEKMPTSDHTYYAEPTLARGMVYAGLYSTNATDQAQLHAISLTNGTTRWAFDTDYGIYDAPVVQNGIVYFCAGNINSGGTVYALDSDTGELLWNFDTKEYLKATPTIVDDVVYVYSQHAVYALNAATGQLYWSVTLRAPLFGHPYVVGDLIYIATERNNCYVVDAYSGHKEATFTDVGEMHAALAIGERYYGLCLYEDQFYGLDLLSGETLWNIQIDRHISGNVTVTHHNVLFGTHSGFVGDSARTRLLMIDIPTGTLRWSEHIKHEIEGSPVTDNRYIYLSNLGREINILDAQQGRLLFTARAGYGKLSRPAVENNKLLVSTGELQAYQIK